MRIPYRKLARVATADPVPECCPKCGSRYWIDHPDGKQCFYCRLIFYKDYR